MQSDAAHAQAPLTKPHRAISSNPLDGGFSRSRRVLGLPEPTRAVAAEFRRHCRRVSDPDFGSSCCSIRCPTRAGARGDAKTLCCGRSCDGPGRDRTCDLGIKSPLLYRLSYRPAAVECRSGRPGRLYTPTRPPSTSGLGHHPFKVAARVRIPLGASLCSCGCGRFEGAIVSPPCPTSALNGVRSLAVLR